MHDQLPKHFNGGVVFFELEKFLVSEVNMLKHLIP